MTATEQIPSLSVVIPVYNEESTIDQVLTAVSDQEIVTEIVIIDDCSQDNSPAIITREADRLESKRPELKVLFFQNEKNKGKGGSLKKGFQHTTGDVIVIQDADLEYDPQEYINLIRPIAAGQADVVYGSRFIGGTHRVLYYWHYLGNKTLTLLSNMFSNLNLTDMETCYKMFRRELLDGIEFKSSRFGLEPEFTAKVARAGLRIYEMPISYHGRTYNDGKKITWRDGLAAIFHIIRYNVFR